MLVGKHFIFYMIFALMLSLWKNPGSRKIIYPVELKQYSLFMSRQFQGLLTSLTQTKVQPA